MPVFNAIGKAMKGALAGAVLGPVGMVAGGAIGAAEGASDMASGGPGQPQAQIPQPQGNPMTQSPMASQQQQQPGLDLDDQENPFAGGLPGGGGWMA
jgi:hypothetical protein